MEYNQFTLFCAGGSFAKVRSPPMYLIRKNNSNLMACNYFFWFGGIHHLNIMDILHILNIEYENNTTSILHIIYRDQNLKGTSQPYNPES